jgi:hypothetical protein
MSKKTKQQKPLYQSLTVQAAILLSLVVLAKIWLPHVGVELPAELFDSLLAAFGVPLIFGLRRAMPVLIMCCALSVSHCGPSVCSQVTIDLDPHPTKKSPPAAKVVVKCDDETKAEILADEVKTP